MRYTAIDVIDRLVLGQCLAPERARFGREVVLVGANGRGHSEGPGLGYCRQFHEPPRGHGHLLSPGPAGLCPGAVRHRRGAFVVRAVAGTRKLLGSSITNHAAQFCANELRERMRQHYRYARANAGERDGGVGDEAASFSASRVF